MPDNLYCDQTTPWQGVYFLTSTAKVSAVRLANCYIVICVVGIIIDYVFIKTLLVLKKKAIKIGAPKFWPSYHYSSVVQTASNWNLQKLLKSEL